MSELRFPNVNTVVISGRLTRDVELRYTPSGTPVANISIAFSRKYQVNGEWKEDSSFVDVVVWNKRAEQCGQELHKGSPVLVEGYLQTRSYTTKDNQNRKITEIVANKVSFLEKTGSVGSGGQPSQQPQQTAPSITEDNLPF